MRLAVLARHGQSVLNVEGLVNGNPANDKGLSPVGFEQGRQLGVQLAALTIDRCVHSEFPRARQTAELALGGRDVPQSVDPDLNDIQIGELDGLTLADYRAWKRAQGHTRDTAFPGGESLNDAAHRYADAYERVCELADEVTLIVCHEIPVRYAVNAAGGSESLDSPLHDVPNATPYLFDEASLRRAVDRIRELAAQ